MRIFLAPYFACGAQKQACCPRFVYNSRMKILQVFFSRLHSLSAWSDRLDAGLAALAGRRRWLVFGAFFVLTMLPYLGGAWLHHTHINQSIYWADQGDYYYYAARLHLTGDLYAGDFNRTPLYPWLHSLFYQAGEHPLTFFERGLLLNVTLSVLLLAALFAYFVRTFRPLLAINLYLIVAFMVYMFKAAYLHAELLYYTLAFGAFVLMVRQLRTPRWSSALALGLVAPLAQLTKGALMPSIALFVVMVVLQVVVEWAQNRRHALTRLAQLGAVLALFTVGMWPYFYVSYTQFGNPFYNVNTTFYMWEDGWTEVKDGVMQSRPDLRYPESSPTGDVPTVSTYVRDNSPQDMLARITHGLWVQWKQHTNTGYGYQWYAYAFVLLTVAVLLLAARRGVAVRAALAREWPLLLFAVGYFGGYLLLYSFYVPIQPGKRFLLALLLPLLWLSARTLTAPRWGTITVGGYDVRTTFNALLLILVSLHSILNLIFNVSSFPAA